MQLGCKWCRLGAHLHRADKEAAIPSEKDVHRARESTPSMSSEQHTHTGCAMQSNPRPRCHCATRKHAQKRSQAASLRSARIADDWPRDSASAERQLRRSHTHRHRAWRARTHLQKRFFWAVGNPSLRLTNPGRSWQNLPGLQKSRARVEKSRARVDKNPGLGLGWVEEGSVQRSQGVRRCS